MTRDELSLLVRGKVAEVLGVETEEITEDTNLETDHGIDSLELMEIGTRLEVALDVRIQLTDLVQIHTVGQAVEALSARVGASA
ncbi:MAG TPA: acyl carrier protein [Micromonosporaceae bacterium]|nr:acyl carrier protein [Micromonosporaceae bacterium]